MKLQEILKIVSQTGLGFDLDIIKNFKKIKDNYLNDFIIEQGSINDQIVFIIKKEQIIVGALVATIIDDLDLESNREVLMIKRTWCKEKFKNKGIISNLYRYIYNDLKYALISDVEQAPETIKIWDRLRSAWNVKMINLKTKEITKIDTTDLYGDDKYALIVEAINDQHFDGVIKDYLFEMNGY
jgi:hypothetical protein